MAEMSSAYGLVRAWVGPYFGFVAGVLEAMRNVTYVTASVLPFAQMISHASGGDRSYEPAYFGIFFVTAVGLNALGGRAFWYSARVLVFLALLVLMIYVCGAIQFTDFKKYLETEVSGGGGYEFDGYAFVKRFPWASWFFLGLESLPLTCVDCQEVSLFRSFQFIFLTEPLIAC